ncbi:excinuclease ABC subunit B [Yoonia sp.]|uniref:excinuclease ABC subunit B n=1 Tax=Yoonia sp. TaxID=2212373 RepID=UPI0023B5E3F2
MRIALALLLLATPAAAWEFSANPICTLTDRSEKATMTVTYDPEIAEYAITVTLADDTWPTGSTFGMAFASDRPINIQTDRFTLSDEGRSLTVKDRGFSNVLDGLEFNARAYAILGDMTVGFSLDGIETAIEAFRSCPADNLA